MHKIICLIVFLIDAQILSLGQSCTNQALLSVERAKASYYSGDREGAKRLLEQAFSECKTSGIVLRRISETYQLLGDASHAKLYADWAKKLEPGVIFRQPSQTPQTVSSNGASVEDNSFVREKWALVVGISHFQNPKFNLQFAAKDANDFAAMLAAPKIGRFDPRQIKLLTDEKATLEGIKTAIYDIAKGAQSDDLVVFYFSSHGTSADMDVATEKGQTGYIVTYDTDINNLYAKAFPMDELKRAVDTRIKARRVVAFMDTCYSGDTIRKAVEGSKALELGVPNDSFVRIAQGTGRIVIASSRNTEKSWESEQYQNSYFTHYLIEAMKAGDGLLTMTQLFTQLQRAIPSAVMREKNASQNPIIFPEGKNINIVIGTGVQ